MPDFVIYREPKVTLLGQMTFDNPFAGQWETDAPSAGEALVEFAGRLCFDPATELLTRRGWVGVAEVTEDDEVFTKHPTSHEGQFQPPYAIHNYIYEGDLYVAEGRDVSFAVTPEHRQWGSFLGGERQFIQTDELAGRHFLITGDSAGWSGELPARVVIPGVRITQRLANGAGSYGERVTDVPEIVLTSPTQIRALAFLCAHYAVNGSLRKQVGSGQGITIYGREYADIENLAALLNLPSSRWVDKRGDVPRVLIGGGVQWRKFFEEFCGDSCETKRLPRWVLNMPMPQLDALWDLLVRTDGHRTEKGRETFTSTSPEFVDQAQELLAKLGYPSSLKDEPSEGKVCYRLSRKARRDIHLNKPGRQAQVTARPYVGTVHCVTTENGIVLVRRNGKVHFSGNCYGSYGKEVDLGGHATVNGRPGGNAAYLANIRNSGHGSVCEHAVYSLLIEQVSRSLSHELVRHRAGFSVSQLSQRYVDESNVAFVLPPEITPGTDEWLDFYYMCQSAQTYYDHAIHSGMAKLDGLDLPKTEKLKRVRQTARAGLPNATETKLVFTGNARAWLNFLELRGSPYADREIRLLAVKVADLLKQTSPNMFAGVAFDTNPSDSTAILVVTPHKV